MPYQIKLQLLDRPPKQYGTVEREAIANAISDAAEFLYQTLKANTPVVSGKLANSVRKLAFTNKGSAKAFYDITVAPYAAEAMRGNKEERLIFASHAKALKFVYGGNTIFVHSVHRMPTKGLRVPEKMRQSQDVINRLVDIFVGHLKLDLSAQGTKASLAPVVLPK